MERNPENKQRDLAWRKNRDIGLLLGSIALFATVFNFVFEGKVVAGSGAIIVAFGLAGLVFLGRSFGMRKRADNTSLGEDAGE